MRSMNEGSRFSNSNFTEVFGSLLKTYRLRRGFFEKYLIPSIVFGCALFGVLIYIASQDWLAIPVCVLPFALLFAGLVRHLFRTRADELRIYEHGFTYRSGKTVQICRWTDIAHCHRRERNAREIAEAEPENFPLCSVEKKTGEIIEFDDDLEGTTEIAARFENRRNSSQNKKRRNRRAPDV